MYFFHVLFFFPSSDFRFLCQCFKNKLRTTHVKEKKVVCKPPLVCLKLRICVSATLRIKFCLLLHVTMVAASRSDACANFKSLVLTRRGKKSSPPGPNTNAQSIKPRDPRHWAVYSL